MEKNTIQDERILLERRKIQSTAYGWIVMLLLISIVVQQFFMRAPFSQFAVEFFILIGCSLYNTVLCFKKGIDIWNPADIRKKKILIDSIVCCAVGTILFALLSGESDIKNLALFFATFFLFFFSFRLIMVGINNKKKRRIEQELDSEEMGE